TDKERAMKRMLATGLLCLTAAAWLIAAPTERGPADAAAAPDGWTAAAPRPEIRPAFAYEPAGGPDGAGALVIRADGREGLDGGWTKTFPVPGGKHYRFRAVYKASDVAVPRRSVVVKVNWQDAQGKKVPLDEPAVTGFLRGSVPMAETEFPTT